MRKSTVALAVLAVLLLALALLPTSAPAQGFWSSLWYRSGDFLVGRSASTLRFDVVTGGSFSYSGGSLTLSSSLITSGDVRAGAGNNFYWSTRTNLTAPVDGTLKVANAAGTANGALVLTPTTFANLGTPGNGEFRFCSDCTRTDPCAGGSAATALAKRLNGGWVCN